jgi:hypothetical protein
MEQLKELFKKRNVWLVILLIAFVIIIIIAVNKYNQKKEQEKREAEIKRKASENKVTEKEQELSNYMRKLWGDNATWMRNYIVSYLNGAKDIRESASRLLKNQEQIGRAMGMWYGKDTGKKVASMLQKNMVAFGDMLSAMLNKKKNEAIVAEKRWNDNTDSLASYLSSINPRFDKVELSQNLKKYNELMTTQAINRFRGKHASEINSFDKAYNHATFDVADTLTKGIVYQFPEKFDREPTEVEPVTSIEVETKE